MKRSEFVLVWTLSIVAAIPLWLAPWPVLVDYPQHLAMAAIVRHLGDPAWNLASTYRLALWHPNSAFEILVALASAVLPIGIAGKLVLSLGIAGVGPAALALARRAGTSPLYAILALAFAWNFSLWWGFVGTVLAAPLLLWGIAVADEAIETPSRRGAVLLGALGLAFYVTHLQFLFIFAGCVGWLAITRRIPVARVAAALLPLLPAVVLAVLFVVTREHATTFDRMLSGAPPGFVRPWVRLAVLPVLLFGAPEGLHLESLPTALAAICVAAAWTFRERSVTARFATLAAWLALLFMVMPTNFVGQNVFQRMAALAAMVGVLALPPPKASRAAILRVLVVAACLVEIGLASKMIVETAREADGFGELIASAAPGKRLAGLIEDSHSATLRYPTRIYLNFPAYYQAEKGGTLLVSFAEIGHSVVQFRPEAHDDTLLADLNEDSPILFRWERHAPLFDYFLVRGDAKDLERLFGEHLGELRVQSRGRWHLLERIER